MTLDGIYLDNSMTTKPSMMSVSAMLPFLTDLWGNPSAPHQKGQEVMPSIKEALRSIYGLVGATERDNFVFTSSGAEAVNHAIFSTYLSVTRTQGKNQFITSQIDEAPSIMSIGRLEQLGCVGKLVQPNKYGQITEQAIIEAITPRTAMLSLSWANGLTGVTQEVGEIGAICKERGIIFHIDATHVLGKFFFDLDDFDVDMVSFNGDNLHAPKGTGGLYIRDKVPSASFIAGGIEQGGKRAGSINIPALVALGCAAREAIDARDLLCTEVARLRDKLEQGILKEYPEATIFFANQERIPNCTAIGFPGIINEMMLFALNRKNLFASIGGGSFQQIGLILESCGIEKTLAQTAISFSLSRETTEDDVDNAISIIAETAKRLKKVSE